MKLTLSSTFVDWDAYNLVKTIYDAVAEGRIPDTELAAILSTRETGENETTDQIINRLMRETDIPIIAVSAKKSGRLDKSVPIEKRIVGYDTLWDRVLKEQLGYLPDFQSLLGDMTIRGDKILQPGLTVDSPALRHYRWHKEPAQLTPTSAVDWKRYGRLFSEGGYLTTSMLNLHPDLPPKMGGIAGMYWEVIGEWVRARRRGIGGMVHLAEVLDAGPPLAYFRLPARGIVNAVDLAPLWADLPHNEQGLDRLIREQVALGDKPSHPLFQELRRAEAWFEPALVVGALAAVAKGEVVIGRAPLSPQEGQKGWQNLVFDKEGKLLEAGRDVTKAVVGEAAVWPGGEGQKISPERR